MKNSYKTDSIVKTIRLLLLRPPSRAIHEYLLLSSPAANDEENTGKYIVPSPFFLHVLNVEGNTETGANGRKGSREMRASGRGRDRPDLRRSLLPCTHPRHSFLVRDGRVNARRTVRRNGGRRPGSGTRRSGRGARRTKEDAARETEVRECASSVPRDTIFVRLTFSTIKRNAKKKKKNYKRGG